MNCNLVTDQRRLIPGWFNLKQQLNGTETMIWTMTDHLTDSGACDLCNYEAFLVLSSCGKVDEIRLTKRMIDADGDGQAETMQLLWNVGRFATTVKSNVTYQIVFRSETVNTLGVIGAADDKANGLYKIENSLLEGNSRTFKNSNKYRIKWDPVNGRWTLYAADGVTVIDSQRFQSEEPYCGAWQNVAVSNNAAAVWYSDQAVMQVSESIQGDESTTANFPTILRQNWEYIHDCMGKSGVTALTEWVYTTAWYGAVAPYHLRLNDIFSIPAGCSIVEVRVQKENADGSLTDVDSIEVSEKDGKTWLYCSEKVNGRVTASIRSVGGGYVFIDERNVGHVGGWRVDAPGIAADLQTFNGEKAGFVFYATDTGMYYRKNSDTAGDWSGPYPFRGEQGPPGEAGRPGMDGVSEVYVYNAIEEHDLSGNAHAAQFAGKANETHSHALADVTGLVDALSHRATITMVQTVSNNVTSVTGRVATLEKTLGDINSALADIVGV